MNKRYIKLKMTLIAVLLVFLITLLVSTASADKKEDLVFNEKLNLSMINNNDDNNNQKTAQGAFSQKDITKNPDKILKAAWIAIEDLLIFDKPNTITAYKDKITVDDIDSRLNTIAEYQDENGSFIEIPVYYEWNQRILEVGGITEAVPYVLDPTTGEKLYGKDEQKVDIYILNSPYIQAKQNVLLSVGDRVSIDGREWQAIGIEEVPDYSSRRIFRTTFPVLYDGSEVNTLNVGHYNVFLSAQRTGRNGELIEVAEVVKATVEELDRERAYFWAQAGESIRKLKRKNFYSTDNFAGKKNQTVKIEYKTDFDRSMIVRPINNPIMLNGFLQNLSKHKKALVRIDMGAYQWDLYSRSFQQGYVEDKLDLSVMDSEINNELIESYLSDVNFEVKYFSLDSNWIGEAEFRMVSSLTPVKTLYMFSINKKTNELELIGSMKHGEDGFYSIIMKRASGTYVITDGLPSPLLNPHNEELGASISPYRISEKTNSFDEAIYKEIKEDIQLSNNDINNITLALPVLNELDTEESQIIKDRQIVAGILTTLVFVLLVIITVNAILKAKREKAMLIKEKNSTDGIKAQEQAYEKLNSSLGTKESRRTEGHLNALNLILRGNFGEYNDDASQKIAPLMQKMHKPRMH